VTVIAWNANDPELISDAAEALTRPIDAIVVRVEQKRLFKRLMRQGAYGAPFRLLSPTPFRSYSVYGNENRLLELHRDP
jgi:hypothetical protein